MPGIGVVMNPHSRSNRKHPERARRLAFIVGDKGSCHATQDVLDLERVAEEFAQRQIEILGISGGDGTIHHTISTFLQVYGARPLPMIALLRGGTVNNVSNAVGVRGTPESVLSRIILKYHEGEAFTTLPVHCLAVNGRYGFLWGNGFIANFMADYIRCGEGGMRTVSYLFVRGVTSCLFQTAYVRRLARRFDARVVVDGVEWPFKNYIILNGGAVEPYGFGMRPFYRAREKPGHFHFIGYSMPPRSILSELAPVWLGHARHSEQQLESLAREVHMTFEQPLPYMIDGELYPAVDHLTVRCGPVLTMIQQ